MAVKLGTKDQAELDCIENKDSYNTFFFMSFVHTTFSMKFTSLNFSLKIDLHR